MQAVFELHGSQYAGPPYLFLLPHRANAVAEYWGIEGPHTYFSVIRSLHASNYLIYEFLDCILPTIQYKLHHAASDNKQVYYSSSSMELSTAVVP